MDRGVRGVGGGVSGRRAVGVDPRARWSVGRGSGARGHCARWIRQYPRGARARPAGVERVARHVARLDRDRRRGRRGLVLIVAVAVERGCYRDRRGRNGVRMRVPSGAHHATSDTVLPPACRRIGADGAVRPRRSRNATAFSCCYLLRKPLAPSSGGGSIDDAPGTTLHARSRRHIGSTTSSRALPRRGGAAGIVDCTGSFERKIHADRPEPPPKRRRGARAHGRGSASHD